MNLPTFDDVLDAAKQIDGYAVKTPFLKAEDLSEKLDAEIYIKPECLQRVGAFKFRGAFNRLSRLNDDEKKRGVVAYSSGNHAQGVAASAKILGISSVIVMPEDSPKMKLQNTKNYGAEVITYDRENESREKIADKISEERGSVVVPSFEDFYIISGQGTAGLEAVKQAEEAGVKLDLFMTPVGGGGLISGCSLAVKALSPDTEIYGVEPEGFDDVRRSIESGNIEHNPRAGGSICDAILTVHPEPMTHKIMSDNLAGVLTVTDDEALAAMKYAWEKFKLVVEPGASVALAAVLHGKIDVKGKKLCIVLSGGNVDEETFKKALEK
ncbi:threonine ammonia-lyase [Pseudemcibacter aquimaris]|uniref:threonine ammonia-lyase n=1 Tax=Pseudemcibacter aquimaris TaxID=2857064 RepID=UPI002011AB3E|nr:threonine/serine dehydratase [Pseudemcibacter aquimaris]MCC3860543.1 threonine/serine dehydratase [Pseudemcibacter aquimaris]WDU59367.1 threonine/serine dehydratase [Pseudemcibacter aquimaris]